MDRDLIKTIGNPTQIHIPHVHKNYEQQSIAVDEPVVDLWSVKRYSES